MGERLIDVEYEPNTRADHYVRKRNQIYLGVGERPSDGFTTLKIKAPGASRVHNIEVGQVYAVTVDGRRHVMETPRERWKLRAQEIARAIEGRFSEDWVAEYFDPSSSKYFKHSVDYESPVDLAAEKAFADPARNTVKQSALWDPADAVQTSLHDTKFRSPGAPTGRQSQAREQSIFDPIWGGVVVVVVLTVLVLLF